MENNEKIEVKHASIDREVLDIMKQEDILEAIKDEKQLNRLKLNFFCEFLSEIRELRKEFDDFMQMISVCSADKVANFFKELQTNVAQEEKRLELHEKIKQSHKKSTKKTKKVSKSAESV